MIATDKNIETISQLVEALGRYLSLEKDYIKLDAISKIVTLLKGIAILFVGILIGLFVILFLSAALAYFLSEYVGTEAAFCIMAAIYFVVFLLFIIFRRTLIEKPLVSFLTSLLLE